MIKAIVFDFDGVLVNSEPTHLAALQQALSSMGVDLTSSEYYERYLGLDDAGLFQTLAREGRLRADGAGVLSLVQRKAGIFNEMTSQGVMLFPGARQCVAQLAARFPLGIASGALRHEIDAMLAGSNLRSFFAFIVASGDTPHSKPHPDPYRLSATLHQLPPAECLAIEDSRWGIQSAKVAGLHCVGITHTYPAAELTGADRVIDSLAQFTPELIDAIGR